MNENIPSITFFSLIDGSADKWNPDPQTLTLENVSLGHEHHGLSIESHVYDCTVTITDVPEHLRGGEALSCPVLIRVGEAHEGGLEVRRQRKSPTDNDRTETWVLSER